MIPIHFPEVRGEAEVLPIARALGVGPKIENSPFYLYHFDPLLKMAPTLWQAVEAERAALFIYPYFYEADESAMRAMRLAESRKVPILFFKSTDLAAPVTLPYGIIYRDSIFADQMTASERAMPALCGNMLVNQSNQVQVRNKTARASVGFCGYVGTAMQRLAYRLSGRREKYLGLALRRRALRGLRRGKKVECLFLVRDKYWGGVVGQGPKGLRHLQPAHLEYVENVFNSDYTLCIRGAGNFSFRFYETLAAGRIPLFVNTRCVLPFADRIDYRKHCAWVEEAEMGRLGERLAEFHERLTAEAFGEMQRANRRLWEEWFEPLAFYKHILADVLGTGSLPIDVQGAGA